MEITKLPKEGTWSAVLNICPDFANLSSLSWRRLRDTDS